ncbi:hypothetical protein VN97_g4702 [Penicillium thymicola]|uniref:Ketosynthase family 3 (KS3) domain-containing protein n=1 Tax=Penicillium thymicola TaxID=293382 RepID=A0AAI9X998_PENTH|nr:hypothetical protein VN97_g4702 [Penicillium thymicola]
MDEAGVSTREQMDTDVARVSGQSSSNLYTLLYATGTACVPLSEPPVLTKIEESPGITVPSVAAQAQLIRNVYKSADLDPSQTGYVEAHGTGTQVGDPLEVQAIVSALADRIRDTPLYVGSVKSVVGHLEGRAGLAGLISATLAVESKTVPPVAGLKTLNPRIVQRDDLKFARQATPWPRDDILRASINSFGFGGTNAPIVLDDVEGFLNEFLGSHLTGTLQVISPSSTTTSRQVHVHAIKAQSLSSMGM